MARKNWILNKLEQWFTVSKWKRDAATVMQFHLDKIHGYEKDHASDIARSNYIRDEFYKKALEVVSDYLDLSRADIPAHFFDKGTVINLAYLNFEIDAATNTVEVFLQEKPLGSFIFKF